MGNEVHARTVTEVEVRSSRSSGIACIFCKFEIRITAAGGFGFSSIYLALLVRRCDPRLSASCGAKSTGNFIWLGLASLVAVKSS